MPNFAQHFQQIKAGLNPNQRRAVEHLTGPIGVIAGPGTGKTHILAARIGQILTETDTPPAAILCLTFTDAAAHAMRQRLLELIGPDAWRVPIQTFHKFCNRVIQENADFFGRHDLEPVSDLERIELIRRLLDGLPPDHPLKKGRRDPHFFERHLADFFGRMKSENWSPRLVQQQAKAWLEDLPTRKEFIYQRKTAKNQPGDLKTELLENARQQMERLTAAADLFPKFRWQMEQARRYDFDDMISWVVRAFAENAFLLRHYQERFLWFLVDEFQDTNGAQNQVLRSLISFWESPNVFIVGDDDQSIFEFQGARLKNLLDFFVDYGPEAELVVLSENYRSSQKILDAARSLVEKNRLRAIQLLDFQPFEKNLTARNPVFSNSKSEPRILVFENRLAEDAEIVRQIGELQKAGEPLNEVAVIYAQHRQADRLMSLLDKKGIPFQTRRPANVLDQPIIGQLRSLLIWLEKESREPFSGEAELFKILNFRFLKMEPIEVARLVSYKKEGEKIRTQLADFERVKSKKLTDFSSQIESWLAEIHELPLPVFLEKIIQESGLLDHILAQPEKIWLLQLATTFLDFVKKETARQPRISLRRLLEILETLDANRLPMPVEQAIRTGTGVQLLTAHGAKGLEFRHVFMLDCTADFWENHRGGGSKRFAMPDTLTFSGEEDATEARRRLFYVAMTRAKEFLTMSCAKIGADGKPLVASIFLEETGIEPSQVFENQALALDSQIALLSPGSRPTAQMPPADLLDELLADFEMNISALNRFLRCPLAFYYEDVLRVPRSASESSLFGQAMHHALLRFFEIMKRGKKLEFGDAADLVAWFEIKMESLRGLFSEAGFVQKIGYGRVLLENQHAAFSKKWRKNVLVERRFDHIELDGIPLTGVIDKLEFVNEAGNLHVVDYKTARPNPSKLSPPTDKIPLGGDYWRQLVFYKILLDSARSLPNLPLGGTVSGGSLAWLEPDRRGVLIQNDLVFNENEVVFVKNQVREVWAKIRAHEFSVGCGEADCGWCKLHLDNETTAHFPETDADGLDDDV